MLSGKDSPTQNQLLRYQQSWELSFLLQRNKLRKCSFGLRESRILIRESDVIRPT